MILLDAYQKLNTRQLMEFARDRYGVNSILGKVNANPKVAKNAKNKTLSVPVHLSPAKTSGYNVCAKSRWLFFGLAASPLLLHLETATVLAVLSLLLAMLLF